MTRSRPNPTAAIALMLLATAFIAGTMMMAKLLGTDRLGPPLHPLQISHGRFVFALIAIAGAAAVLRPRFSRPNLPIHLGRSVFGWMGVTCMFAAVAFIPLSDATAISFLNPVFGMLLAIPLLGERVGKWRWLAAAMALTGALILLRPGAGTFQAPALLALAAAGLLGMELIFIKKLADREPPLQILLINNTIGCAIASVVVIAVYSAPTSAQWGALVALGVLMAGAQACFVNAMARADASFVTPFSYVTLIFAALYDLALFDVVPDRVSWLGAVIILTGAVLLAARERAARNA
ncbi:DMT family transporter [Yoonia sp. R2331]|uniref:DMT family transporter n=1 Tax=Yoonia sp. R2331 TaxID=3237238 RepID=UPI0034E5267C